MRKSKNIFPALLQIADVQQSLPPQLNTPSVLVQDITSSTATVEFLYPGPETDVDLYLTVNGIEKGIQSSPEILSGFSSLQDVTVRLIARKAGYTDSAPTIVAFQTLSYDIVISQQAQAQSLHVGDTLVLSVVASNVTSYQWQKLINNNWINIIGATSPTYALSSIDFTTRGQYRPELINTQDTVIGSVAVISVNRTPVPLGILYDKNEWTDLSDFVLTNVSASLVGGKIFVTPTDSGYNSSIGLSMPNTLEKFKLTIKYSIGSIGSGSITGIGPRSINPYLPATASTNLGFSMEGQSSQGSLYYRYTNNYVATAVTGLIAHSGDVIEQIYEQLDVNTVQFTFTNLTSGQPPIITVTPPSVDAAANTHLLSLFAILGSVTLQSFKFESAALANVMTAFKGDSKTHGTAATDKTLRYAQLVGAAIGNYTIQSGGGDTTVQAMSTLYQTLLINAEVNVFAYSTNDIRFIGSNPTTIPNIISNIQAHKIAIEAAGNKFFILSTFWESEQDVLPIVTAIRANFTSDIIIDIYDALVGHTEYLVGDGVHPNDLGHSKDAELILSSGQIQSALTT